MKKELYGIYRGKEYKVALGRNMEMELISYDSLFIHDGFEVDGDIYFKEVKKEDLEELYNLTSYAIYKGYKF